MHILMIDRQSIFIEGMTSALKPFIPEIKIYGIFNQQDIYLSLGQFPASLILLDGDGNKNDGLKLLDELAEKLPSVPVVMLVNKYQPAQLRQFLRHHAVAAIRRDSPPATIAQTLQTAAMGMLCFPHESLHSLNESGDASTLLSDRQKEILKLLAAGESNKQISRQLNISAGTVKAHLESIFRRLNVSNRTQAAMLYTEE
ncbi:response regulator transcription factor [Cedecea neteri]|uniref:response regulator transcription factor n=1 Tax=Cedecea neteri TaxID=158822 RepID=UPI002AA8CF9F|nr:response regulator transcription factor [Cedecea neteri]WPU23602.1 response regulator transcription factor [Cedecea neteri]